MLNLHITWFEGFVFSGDNFLRILIFDHAAKWCVDFI